MLRVTRLLLCAVSLGVFLPAIFVSAETPGHPIVGIGDDKPDMFNDARFLALGIRNVRYDMAWDALSVRAQRTAVIRWMERAKADGLSVLVTIDHSDKVTYRKVRIRGKTKTEAVSQARVLPGVAEYLSAFKAFRKLFPSVTQFATWDETNFYGEATYDRETLVAGYYRALRTACPKCTILAAELLDVPKSEAVPIETWTRAFIKAAGGQPPYWGLNNYHDANRVSSTSTRQLLAAVRGNIWLAETGGIVGRQGVKAPGFLQDATHAAAVDRFILDTIGSLSPRIQRIYLYEWDATAAHAAWDTALISYTGLPRAGYNVLADTLKVWGIKPNCAISRVPPTCSPAPPRRSTSTNGATS